MFDLLDYQRGATAIGGGTPVRNLMAVSAIESSGENFWTIGNKQVPPLRFEAQWFDRQTGGRFRLAHPDLSSASWNPSLAATTRAGAWDQYQRAAGLDPVAAAEASSWGPFQIMGFHWRAMGFAGVAAFVDAMDGPDDDGQMDTFVQFVKDDPRLLQAIRNGDWDTWETVYNGGGYGGAYAAKIRAWLAEHSDVRTPPVPRVLVRGNTGDDVARIQKALGVVPDGDFGPATEAAVRMVQEHYGLVVDGKVGMMTLRKLGLAN